MPLLLFALLKKNSIQSFPEKNEVYCRIFLNPSWHQNVNLNCVMVDSIEYIKGFLSWINNVKPMDLFYVSNTRLIHLLVGYLVTRGIGITFISIKIYV